MADGLQGPCSPLNRGPFLLTLTFLCALGRKELAKEGKKKTPTRWGYMEEQVEAGRGAGSDGAPSRPQAAGPAAATLLWPAWGGVCGHRGPPLSMLPGVLSCQRHSQVPWGRPSGGELCARPSVCSNQWPEEAAAGQTSGGGETGDNDASKWTPPPSHPQTKPKAPWP